LSGRVFLPAFEVQFDAAGFIGFAQAGLDHEVVLLLGGDQFS
jgi:hypothetical protein